MNEQTQTAPAASLIRVAIVEDDPDFSGALCRVVDGAPNIAYAPALCFVVFGVLMYRRYVAAIAEVEQVNASLAERRAAREAELETSHRKLRQVERLQTISDERQRLMQDMRDGLGSSLISAIRSVERSDVGAARVSQILKNCLDDLKLTID